MRVCVCVCVCVLVVCKSHRYRKSLCRLHKVCYVPANGAVLIAFFSSLLLRPLTVLMKQTRQAVHAVKQSIYLDVYSKSTYDEPIPQNVYMKLSFFEE